MTLPLRPPDDPVTLRAAIEAVQVEHFQATGRHALHVGHCTREDLHDRLIALWARWRVLTDQGPRSTR